MTTTNIHQSNGTVYEKYDVNGPSSNGGGATYGEHPVDSVKGSGRVAPPPGSWNPPGQVPHYPDSPQRQVEKKAYAAEMQRICDAEAAQKATLTSFLAGIKEVHIGHSVSLEMNRGGPKHSVGAHVVIDSSGAFKGRAERTSLNGTIGSTCRLHLSGEHHQKGGDSSRINLVIELDPKTGKVSLSQPVDYWYYDAKLRKQKSGRAGQRGQVLDNVRIFKKGDVTPSEAAKAHAAKTQLNVDLTANEGSNARFAMSTAMRSLGFDVQNAAEKAFVDPNFVEFQQKDGELRYRSGDDDVLVGNAPDEVAVAARLNQAVAKARSLGIDTEADARVVSMWGSKRESNLILFAKLQDGRDLSMGLCTSVEGRYPLDPT